MAELAKWESFYVIVGTAGGALIGVQFVIVTLLANMRLRPTAESIHAFATPTVVNFGAALLVSAIMSVPWPSLLPASVVLVLCGLGGLGYLFVVADLVRRQTRYKAVREDWLWYVILPCGLHATLAVAAIFLGTLPQHVLFVVAGASLGLLVVGIRNAWDTVTHIVVDSPGATSTTE